MHRVSEIYIHKGKTGFWLRWLENGKPHTKSFITKDEARIFKKRKYFELNTDVFSSSDKPFDDAVKEYLKTYDLRGLSAKSKLEPDRVLRVIKELICPQKTSDINQRSIDFFIETRLAQKKYSRWSINKDLGCIKAFINWLKKRSFHNGKIDFIMLKAPQVVKKALTTDQIRALLKACPTLAWTVRILLSLTTGLRSGDIDDMPVAVVDIKRSMLDYTKSQKTGKIYYNRPLPAAILPVLEKYLKTVSGEKLFADIGVRKAFDVIKAAAGVSCTRKDMRVTFSTLMQKIGGISTARDLLEHSSGRTTADFYTDREAVLFWKIQQLNPIVIEWLKD